MRSALTHFRITNRHFPSGFYWRGCFCQYGTRMTYPNVQDCADRCRGVCLLYFSEMTSLTCVSVCACNRQIWDSLSSSGSVVTVEWHTHTETHTLSQQKREPEDTVNEPKCYFSIKVRVHETPLRSVSAAAEAWASSKLPFSSNPLCFPAPSSPQFALP